MREYCISLHAFDGSVRRQLVVSEEQRTYEHEDCPDRHREENSDESGLFCTLIVLCSEIALYDCLVCAILLQSVEETIESHHKECCLNQIPLKRTDTNLAHFVWSDIRSGIPCCLKDVACREWCAECAEKEDDTEKSAADEHAALDNVHPDDGLHTAEESEEDDGHAEHGYNPVDVNIHERSESH